MGHSDWSEVYAEEANRGIELDEARATEDDAAFDFEGQPYATEQHHWFAQQYRDEFEEQGINIDEYVSDIDRDNHQGVLHANDENGSRNHEWNNFFEENESPTREQMVEQAISIKDSEGFADFDTHAYRDFSESTDMNELSQEVDEDGAFSTVDIESSESDEGFLVEESTESVDGEDDCGVFAEVDMDTSAEADDSFSESESDASADASADAADGADGGDGGGDGGDGGE